MYLQAVIIQIWFNSKMLDW